MTVSAFFYGSYMDADVLRKYGANPGPSSPATLTGWRLTFTPHANLVPDAAGMVEGVCMELSDEDAARLYGPDGFVTTYAPVEVETSEGPRTTYVEDAVEQTPNPEYVDALLAIGRKVGLSQTAVDSIAVQAQRLAS